MTQPRRSARLQLHRSSLFEAVITISQFRGTLGGLNESIERLLQFRNHIYLELKFKSSNSAAEQRIVLCPENFKNMALHVFLEAFKQTEAKLYLSLQINIENVLVIEGFFNCFVAIIKEPNQLYANSVSKFIELNDKFWRYVPSHQNAADITSTGFATRVFCSGDNSSQVTIRPKMFN